MSENTPTPEGGGAVPPTPASPYGPPAPGYSQSAQQPYVQQPYAQPAYNQPGYNQPAYNQQGYPAQQYPPSATTNSNAIVALIAGILGVSFFPLIGSIVAVIVAPMARRQIAETGEQGGTLATIGFWLGWVAIGLTVAGALFLFVLFGLLAAGGTASYR